jgi:alpha-1,3-rhamnosyl/mannosyltransferase
VEDLEGLYALASVFAFPSLSEGFGLPLLEAMERGVPVACSNVSALPEVAGGAALLFDPRDPDDVAATILRVLEDPELAQRLTTAGRARQGAFTWSATAERTLDTWERAVAERR